MQAPRLPGEASDLEQAKGSAPRVPRACVRCRKRKLKASRHGIGPAYDQQDETFDHRLDETLGSFGQTFFNLTSSDPLTAWTWGSRAYMHQSDI
ncbi:hypothetical protein BO78DRAFT_421463 [Aspergillus sclerotiicarbonarius CBS 121057]|uniref:Uncharacterized protein n=1 Tax=Aspergillus sclerotiicarbonarius (strain CBS 121057 / IBT 28362) TaxID=1448318 RepID=A0A319EIJ7_ASPSB|nr:hypothetical protein BO78DRAFT_421463 [Aspergillus sclerotiicarbonarius CBS 121057]